MNPTAAVRQSCLAATVSAVQHSLHISAAHAAALIEDEQVEPTATLRTEKDPCNQEVRVVALCVLRLHKVASRLAWRWHLARILLILRLDRFRKRLLVRLVLRARWRIGGIITCLRLIVRSCHSTRLADWAQQLHGRKSHETQFDQECLVSGYVYEQVMRRQSCAVKCSISRMWRCIAGAVTCALNSCRTGLEVEEAQKAPGLTRAVAQGAIR